jgi:hypothetical protein
MLFLDKPSLSNASYWQIAGLIAILFRVEGIAFIIGLPFYLFIFFPFSIAVKQYLKLNYLFAISLVLAFAFTIETSGITAAFSKIMTVTNYINPTIFLETLQDKITIIESQVLNKYSAKYAAFILSSGLVFMLVYKLIKALSIGYIGLYLFHCWQQKKVSPTPYLSLLIYFAILNFVVLLAFLFHEYFMSRRYTMMMLISLLLLMLPRLAEFIENAWITRKKAVLYITGFILLVSLIDGITQSNSKAYIKETAIWASQNLPANSSVITDDKIIQYYYNTHHPKASLSLVLTGAYWDETYNFNKIKQEYQGIDYLIVVEKRKNTQLQVQLSEMKLELMHSKATKKGDKASVYKILSD